MAWGEEPKWISETHWAGPYKFLHEMQAAVNQLGEHDPPFRLHSWDHIQGGWVACLSRMIEVTDDHKREHIK